MALPFVGEIRASSFHPSFDETANKKQRSSLIAPLPILSVPFTLEPDRITYSIIQFLYNRIPSRSSFLNDKTNALDDERTALETSKNPFHSVRSSLRSHRSDSYRFIYIYIFSWRFHVLVTPCRAMLRGALRKKLAVNDWKSRYSVRISSKSPNN